MAGSIKDLNKEEDPGVAAGRSVSVERDDNGPGSSTKHVDSDNPDRQREEVVEYDIERVEKVYR